MMRLVIAAFVALLCQWTAAPAAAHPMPDTEITVLRGEAETHFAVRMPLSDLQLALPPGTMDGDDTLSAEERVKLAAYIFQHMAINSPQGEDLPLTINSVAIAAADDADVGHYRELEMVVSAPASAATPIRLTYDAIMHRIANHRAFVASDVGEPIGIIRFNLAEAGTNPVDIPAVSSAQPATVAERHEKAPVWLWAAIGIALMGGGILGLRWFLRR